MTTNTKLSNAAKVAILFDFHGLRGTASGIIARFMMEAARDGQQNEQDKKLVQKICNRWKLHDFKVAIFKAYQDDFLEGFNEQRERERLYRFDA